MRRPATRPGRARRRAASILNRQQVREFNSDRKPDHGERVSSRGINDRIRLFEAEMISLQRSRSRHYPAR